MLKLTFHNLQSHLACGHTKMYTLTHNLWKFGEDTILQTLMLVNKIPKNATKSKGSFTTCSHIWHVGITKCAYWLYTYSVKVCGSYVLPNTNAVHFSNIIFKHRAVLPPYSKNYPFCPRTFFLKVIKMNKLDLFEKNTSNFEKFSITRIENHISANPDRVKIFFSDSF